MLHFWRPTGSKDGRSYHHYLYKTQPYPPFRAVQLSVELPLKTHPKYKQVTFAAGLDLVNSTAAESALPEVLISYGSGDASGRVLRLSLEEVEQLFMRGPAPARPKPGL